MFVIEVIDIIHTMLVMKRRWTDVAQSDCAVLCSVCVCVMVECEWQKKMTVATSYREVEVNSFPLSSLLRSFSSSLLHLPASLFSFSVDV